jgi:hypothetical protein
MRLSNLRVVTFLSVVAAFIAVDFVGPSASWVAWALGGLFTVVFVGQVIAHRRARRAERREGALAAVAREGLLRLGRDWDALDDALPEAERASDEPRPDHAYAQDIGVTGRVSLTRLMGPVTSNAGRSMLRSWLLDAATPETVARRHGAVRELASLADLRAEYTALGRLNGPKALEGLGPFFHWAEGEAWTTSRPGLRVAAWLLPSVLFAGIAGQLVFGLPPWWIIPAVAQLVIVRQVARSIADEFSQAAVGGRALPALVSQLHLLSGRSWNDPLLLSLAARLGDDEEPAHRRLERLSRLLDTLESRRNLFYVVLAPVLMLDLHLSVALDRWRAAHGHALRDWLGALGEWEALSALATLAHDHPDWVDPTFVVGGDDQLDATALGHPLLHPDACVRNDVSVGPSGTFLFVTGSNMSGKSTLLRAIGANAVLAGAGAPVCATALTLPPVRVHTSMHIQDSLAEGISLFMAELLRIKKIVDLAGTADSQGRPVLYLLDEILHGTNTAERQIAARGVLRHLLASGAIGAVSTHDLTLADAPDLARAAHAVHFREEVESRNDAQRGTMLTFDYELREGIATTRNALKLLDAVGLGALGEGEEH